MLHKTMSKKNSCNLGDWSTVMGGTNVSMVSSGMVNMVSCNSHIFTKNVNYEEQLIESIKIHSRQWNNV